MVGVPERDRLATGDPHRPQRVAVVERPGEGDDTDAGAHATGAPADRGGMAASLPAGGGRAGGRGKGVSPRPPPPPGPGGGARRARAPPGPPPPPRGGAGGPPPPPRPPPGGRP